MGVMAIMAAMAMASMKLQEKKGPNLLRKKDHDSVRKKKGKIRAHIALSAPLATRDTPMWRDVDCRL